VYDDRVKENGKYNPSVSFPDTVGNILEPTKPFDPHVNVEFDTLPLKYADVICLLLPEISFHCDIKLFALNVNGPSALYLAYNDDVGKTTIIFSLPLKKLILIIELLFGIPAVPPVYPVGEFK
jgi:hypothetical protein